MLTNNKYKVVSKSGAAWRSFKKARLQVSVGQSKHSGEKFQSTLVWADKNFHEIMICVNDTLQRFNLMADEINESDAYNISFECGEQWIKDNLGILQSLQSKKITVSRWNEWLAHPDFRDNLSAVNQQYEKNLVFKNAVDSDINRFADKKNPKNISLFKEYSRRYLLEESAVFAIMSQIGSALDIYPGSEINTTKIAREHQIDFPKGLGSRNYMRIDFRKTQYPKAANRQYIIG